MAALTDAEIAKGLSSLSGWVRAGAEIRKEYRFADFKGAMAFVNRVAGLAEESDHHPDIVINYNKVALTLTSHDTGGLTDRDFRLAARIDG
jgi:4a-hydroxytetrahydrobiopterin dehydratase